MNSPMNNIVSVNMTNASGFTLALLAKLMLNSHPYANFGIPCLLLQGDFYSTAFKGLINGLFWFDESDCAQPCDHTATDNHAYYRAH